MESVRWRSVPTKNPAACCLDRLSSGSERGQPRILPRSTQHCAITLGCQPGRDILMAWSIHLTSPMCRRNLEPACRRRRVRQLRSPKRNGRKDRQLPRGRTVIKLPSTFFRRSRPFPKAGSRQEKRSRFFRVQFLRAIDRSGARSRRREPRNRR